MVLSHQVLPTTNFVGDVGYLGTRNNKVFFNSNSADWQDWVQLQIGELVSVANAALFINDEAVTITV